MYFTASPQGKVFLSAPVFNGYEKSVELYATPSLKVVGKTLAQNVGNSSPRKMRRTTMLFTCANLKISYVLNDKISITLLNYLKNKVWRTKPRAKIGKEWKMRQEMWRIFWRNANYHELNNNHLAIELIGTKNLLLIYSAFTFSHAAQAAMKFR